MRVFVSLFVGIWVARYLGPEQFGLFSYAQSFVAIFAVIASLGLNAIIVRELMNNENRQFELIGTAFFLKVIGAVFVLLILAIAVSFISNKNNANILIFIIASSTIFQSFNVIDYYFQSKVLSKYVVFVNIIALSLSSVVKIGLILNESPLIAFAWVVLFDSVLLAFGYLYFFLKVNTEFSFYKLKFNKKIALSLLKDSWPFILSAVAVSVYMKIDQVMIQEMLGSEATGQYAAAVRLSEAWYFVPVVIAGSLFPAILNAKKKDQLLYDERIQNLYDLMMVLAVMIIIPTLFFSDIVVQILFGEAYNKTADVLVLYIWSGIFVFLGIASGKWLLAENLQIYATINTAIGAVLNICLNYVLIDKMGIKGSAFATLISYGGASYFCLLLWKPTRVNFFKLSKSLFLLRVLGIQRLLNNTSRKKRTKPYKTNANS